MKRILLVLTVGLLVAMFATSAFAQRGYGGGRGGNCGNCNGGGMNGGYGGYNNQNSQAVATEADAKALVEQYISENFKGYKVGAVTTYSMPRGNMYQVEATDASGNSFVFHVNPWGNVRGPMQPYAPNVAPVK